MAAVTWKPPKSIKDGGLTWTVLLVETIPGDDGKADRDTLGLTDAEKLCVYIKSGLPIERMRQTFIHELIHIVLTGMGHEDQDERLVDGIAHAIHRLTKDNPGLLR